MKLGIVTTSFFPGERCLGISNTVNLIAKNLIRDGIDVTIYTVSAKGFPYKEVYENIAIKRFDFTKPIPGVDYNVSIDMLNALIKDDLDIIHSFHYAYFPATAGFIAAKIKKIPHIFTTSYHPEQLTSLKGFMMKLYDVTQGRFILKGSYRSLPQNIDELNHLKKIVDFDHKIVPCPINENIFHHRNVKGGKKTILFVGTMIPWKGAGIAVDICKEIEKEYRNVRFVFVGGGPLRKELMKNTSKRFRFLENISNRELAFWYNKADVFLYPTRYESFGRVLAEAQLCGAPVVTTRVGGVPETVGSPAFLVNYGDWDKMKEQTIRLLNDSRLRKRVSKQSVKHAQKYKSAVVANTIAKIYRDALRV